MIFGTYRGEPKAEAVGESGCEKTAVSSSPRAFLSAPHPPDLHHDPEERRLLAQDRGEGLHSTVLQHPGASPWEAS